MNRIFASLLAVSILIGGGGLVADQVKQSDNKLKHSGDSSKCGSCWFAGWGRALQRAFTPEEYDFFGSGTYFGPIFRDGVTNRTVRLIEHMSAGGSKIRLTFQNQMFDPTTQSTIVTIAQVNVAKQDSAQSIVPGTDKLVTFNQGQTSVQIFPGGTVVSDPIPFKVKPGDNLAVSVYFQDPSGPPPFLLEVGGPGPNYIPTHGGYVALDSGNRNTDVSFPVDPVQNVSGRIWLSGIDVCQSSHSSGKTIACWGDSIILGTGSTADAYQAFPDQLADRLQKTKQGKAFGVVNLGINGNKVTDGSYFGPFRNPVFGGAALNRFPADLLTQPSLKYIIFLEGLNDITSNRSADQVINGIRQWVKLVKKARPDVQIFGSPILPFKGQSAWTPALESVRQEVNAWIRTQSDFDAIIDFDKVIKDPNDPEIIYPPYDSGDHYHPNDKGFRVMAKAVKLKLFCIQN